LGAVPASAEGDDELDGRDFISCTLRTARVCRLLRSCGLGRRYVDVGSMPVW